MKHIKLLKSVTSKVLVGSIVSGLLFTNTMTAQAATLKDLNACAPYAKEAVSALSASNIISGGSNGYFNPTETLTRGHMITMLVRALGHDTTNIPAAPTFNDVPVDHWAYKYVETAYREGIITKSPTGKFGINDKCTRQQMAAMFVRSLGLKDEQINNQQELINVGSLKDKSKIAGWARDHVEFVMYTGLMTGSDGKFSANTAASRQQAAVVIYRYLNSKANTMEAVYALTAPVQYPELFEALKSNMQGYKGELSSNVILKMFNKTLKEDVNFIFNISGSANGMDAHLKAKMNFSGTGLPTSSMEYDALAVGNKTFVKMPGETKWMLIPADDQSSANISAATTSSFVKYEQFMRSYRRLAITKAGLTDINGTSVTKYEITLNKEAFKNMFAELTAQGYFDQSTDIEEILENPYEGKIEVYLDGQNRIVRDNYTFKANMKFIEGDDIDINSTIDTTYTNIGTEFVITAPPLSEVVGPNYEDAM